MKGNKDGSSISLSLYSISLRSSLTPSLSSLSLYSFLPPLFPHLSLMHSFVERLHLEFFIVMSVNAVMLRYLLGSNRCDLCLAGFGYIVSSLLVEEHTCSSMSQ